MDKIRDIDKYIDTVKLHSNFFKSYYFHSLIDLNLTKLDSILYYGILSKNLIEQKCLTNLYTHNSFDFDSKNGNKKFDMANPTYIDVVMKLNNNQIPIYEIKRKSLKSII